MKFIKSLVISMVSIHSTSFAATTPEISCRVVKVIEDQNWMEEGLGTYGDPSSDSDSQKFEVFTKNGRLADIQLGQSSFEPSNGDVLLRTTEGNNKVFKINPADTDIELKVILYPSERGVVLTAEGGKELAIMATLDCSSLKVLESTDPLLESNAKKMTAKQIAALPKSITDHMSKVDVPSELGDGYYDVKSVKTFRIFDTKDTSLVVGYIDFYWLSYTEGEDITALVRFDRNGLRHGDIETNN